MSRAARLAPAAALVLALSGCGSSPPTHYYELMPVPASSPCPAPAGKPVVVRRVAMPPALDRSGIVSGQGGGRVVVSDQDRWVAPLDGQIRSVMTANLRQRLGDAAVLAPGDPVPPGGVEGIAITVQRLLSDASGRVTLAADFALEPPNRPAGLAQHVRLVLDAGSARAEAVVPVMSAALGRLADRIAGTISPGCTPGG
jgi:hypothetical protein